jgi:hypothetical protein
MGAIVNSKVITVLLSVGLFCFSHLAYSKPKFDAPPRAKVELISSSLKTEGIELSIRRFEVISMTVEEVLNFYREEWGERVGETDLPPWKMIGTKQKENYWNVQVQRLSGGGSWGYLSVSDLPDILKNKKPLGIEANAQKRFPMMTGSQVVNDLLHDDVGKKARTLMLRNSSSVSSNADYYRNHYIARGYKATMDKSDLRSRTYLLEFNKLNETVSLVLDSNQGQTTVVANEVKNGF